MTEVNKMNEHELIQAHIKRENYLEKVSNDMRENTLKDLYGLKGKAYEFVDKLWQLKGVCGIVNHTLKDNPQDEIMRREHRKCDKFIQLCGIKFPLGDPLVEYEERFRKYFSDKGLKHDGNSGYSVFGDYFFLEHKRVCISFPAISKIGTRPLIEL